MNDKNLSDALKNIIEKELRALSKLIPKDIMNNIEGRISRQVQHIIEQRGYVKNTKYQNIEKIIEEIEKRISELEKN
jgi:polyhydroxyalkanoate synthesis regulator phasin